MESPQVAEKVLNVVKSNSSDVVFKQPTKAPLRRKRKGKRVLKEETYLDKIAEIIERDFFPDLEFLHAQNDYLNAMERNDILKFRELYAKYSANSPCVGSSSRESVASFNTPSTVLEDPPTPEIDPNASERSQQSCLETSSLSSSKSTRKGQSLDEFLSTHTSEDNQSFEDIIAHAKKQHRIKYHWMYKGEEEAPENSSNFLQLPSIQEQIEHSKDSDKRIETWKFKNRNSAMYTPDGHPFTKEDLIEKAKNKLIINHSATRLHANPFNEQQNLEVVQNIAKNQALSNMNGKIGVDGKEIVANATPGVNGFSFVATPSPAPGVDASPLMTWGQIEGTPFKLDGSDTPTSRTPVDVSFKMPEPPKRERIALALADKVGERYRDRKKKALEAATGKLKSPSHYYHNSPLSVNHMSPAARKLAFKYTPHFSSSDRVLQASYSPRRSPHIHKK